MRHTLVVLMISLAASAWGPAYAQSPPPAASPSASPSGNSSALAEQLFNQARDLAKANQWAEACPKFEASLRYDPVLGTRLNLATCYEHIGKLASAWGLYRESIELARKAGDSKRADYAAKQAAALEPRLPKLAISVPSAPPAGFIVKRDDTALDAGALGVALYVDPGAHKVTASAPGFEPVSVSVTLAEGKTETLAIPALVARPAEPGEKETRPGVESTAADEPAGPRSRTRTFAAIGLGAAGVVAVGVGLVFGAKASSSYKDATALCGDNLVCSADNFNRDKKLVADARSSATLSTVMVIGGGAAIAAAAIVYFTAPRTRETATARVVPAVTRDGGAGLALMGTF
jgi:tetratricopeptide (TPR) repeat protein